MTKPAHPGGFVRHEIIEALGFSVVMAAQALGVTRAALSALLDGRARLSPEMALRIEKAFGVSMDTLMRMQNSYDIAQARTRAAEIKVPLFVGKVPNTKPRSTSPPNLRMDSEPVRHGPVKSLLKIIETELGKIALTAMTLL